MPPSIFDSLLADGQQYGQWESDYLAAMPPRRRPQQRQQRRNGVRASVGEVRPEDMVEQSDIAVDPIEIALGASRVSATVGEPSLESASPWERLAFRGVTVDGAKERGVAPERLVPRIALRGKLQHVLPKNVAFIDTSNMTEGEKRELLRYTDPAYIKAKNGRPWRSP